MFSIQLEGCVGSNVLPEMCETSSMRVAVWLRRGRERGGGGGGGGWKGMTDISSSVSEVLSPRTQQNDLRFQRTNS